MTAGMAGRSLTYADAKILPTVSIHRSWSIDTARTAGNASGQ